LNGDNNGNNCYTVKANNLTLDGTLRAHSGCIIVTITGNFLSEINGSGVGTVDVSSVNDSDAAAEFSLTASGSVTLNGTKVDATGASGNQGGDVVITGTNISGTSPIHADGTSGSGGGAGGSIKLSTTSTTNGDFNIYLTGNVTADAGGGVGSDKGGGTITLSAAGGLTVGTSTKDLEAVGIGGGSGGQIRVIIDLTNLAAVAILPAWTSHVAFKI